MELSGLNPPQREAVTHGDGPLLVLAGAGSGKTRVVTHRIAHLIERGVAPERIGALTFTNKAAGEMRERVAALVRSRNAARALTIGTFHALGLAMLKEERAALGLPRGFVVYDAADQVGCVRELLRARRGEDRRFDARAILTRISLAKNALVAPEDYQPAEADEYGLVAADLYPRYQEALRAFAALDFDDLITEPLRLLRTDPAVSARWRARFDHLLVDEYQDTNRAQLLLVKELSAARGNVCAVGDDDQSIYGWRGAEPENILRFERDFPGARVVVLDQNYRSTSAILDAANAVIAHNPARRGKNLWSRRAGGEKVATVIASDPDREARFVAREIERLAREERRGFGDFAVLYRSNLQTRELEEALREAGIPFVVVGGREFYERKEVKDVLAYLRIALNPRDEIAFRRVVNYPARGVGAATLEKLAARADEAGSLWEAARRVDGVGARTAAGLRGFVEVVERLRRDLPGGAAPALRNLLADIALYDDLVEASPSVAAARRRIDNVESLVGAIERYAAAHPERRALADFVRLLSLDASDDDASPEEARGRVTLTTLHGSKGLEFKVVFLVGCEEELLPHARTLMPRATDVFDPEHAVDVSEERRLVYVGITRAMERLFLTRSSHRRLRGREVPRTPSRFLCEIPGELLCERDLVAEDERPIEGADLTAFFSSLAED